MCAVPSNDFTEAPSEDAGRYVRTCYPSALGEAGAADVLVGSHDVRNIDIRVQRVGSHTVTGTVVSATGKVVDTGHVSARWLEADRSPASARHA